MDFGGLEKILKGVEDNATLLGAIYGVIQDPIANGRGIQGALPFMWDRLTHWKIPKDVMGTIKWALWSEQYSALRNGIGAFIIGYILEAIDANAAITRIGKAVKNAGVGMAVGSGVGMALWLPGGTASPYDPQRNIGQPGAGTSSSSRNLALERVQ